MHNWLINACLCVEKAGFDQRLHKESYQSQNPTELITSAILLLEKQVTRNNPSCPVTTVSCSFVSGVISHQLHVFIVCTTYKLLCLLKMALVVQGEHRVLSSVNVCTHNSDLCVCCTQEGETCPRRKAELEEPKISWHTVSFWSCTHTGCWFGGCWFSGCCFQFTGIPSYSSCTDHWTIMHSPLHWFCPTVSHSAYDLQNHLVTPKSKSTWQVYTAITGVLTRKGGAFMLLFYQISMICIV